MVRAIVFAKGGAYPVERHWGPVVAKKPMGGVKGPMGFALDGVSVVVERSLDDGNQEALFRYMKVGGVYLIIVGGVDWRILSHRFK